METTPAQSQIDTDEPRRLGDILQEIPDITAPVDQARAADTATRDARSELEGLEEQVAEAAAFGRSSWCGT